MAIDSLKIPTSDRMIQIAQQFRSGKVDVLNVPIPQLKAGGVLIRTCASVVSAGTERSKLVLAKKNLIGKAIARPDQVAKVMSQIQRDGIQKGLSKTFNKLNGYSPLGYSAAGIIVAIGEGVSGFTIGDRVSCGGAGYANHAEYVFVPKNLVVPIPEEVEFGEAAFATIGAIALQGIRQAEVRLGDRVIVIGLGLIGLLTAQLLQIAGCVVVGVEPNADRRALATSLGDFQAFHPDLSSPALVRGLTDGMGFDAAIITAATTSKNLLTMAAQTLRDRGRMVILGDVPIEASRELFYRKELELRLSRSYGPGRYDRSYEEGGHDYPIGYIRWTEQRNMAEVLRLIRGKRLQVSPLITARIPVGRAIEGYEALKEGKALAIVIDYEERISHPYQPIMTTASNIGKPSTERVGVSIIGSGSYMGGVLMPILKRQNHITLRGVLSAGGLSAEDFRYRFGFSYATGTLTEILEDVETAALIVATPHREHGPLVHEGLVHDKAVFVEKPLALTREELCQIAYDLSFNQRLMVGYNRRFSRHTVFLKNAFKARKGSAVLNIRVNAGFIVQDHWIQDKAVGGGRIIGEVCHFVDLAQCLVDSPIVSVYGQGLGPADKDRETEDNVSAVLSHKDGSISTIVYTAKGDPTAEKEHIEMFADGIYGAIHDFKYSSVRREGKVKALRGVDKGQRAEIELWLSALKTGSMMPISPDDLIMSTVATLDILKSLQTHETIEVSRL